MKMIASLGFVALGIAGALQVVPASAKQNFDTGGQRISFAQEIVPVLRMRCAVCHMTGSEPGSLRLIPSAAYESLVGKSSISTGRWLVIAGKPEESYLINKLRGTHLDVEGQGSRMPQGQDPLSQEVVHLIETWIEQGAKNN